MVGRVARGRCRAQKSAPKKCAKKCQKHAKIARAILIAPSSPWAVGSKGKFLTFWTRRIQDDLYLGNPATHRVPKPAEITPGPSAGGVLSPAGLCCWWGNLHSDTQLLLLRVAIVLESNTLVRKISFALFDVF